MNRVTLNALVAVLSFLLLAVASSALAQTDPLPSWNDGTAKTAITRFVSRTTEEGGADYVAPAEHIAVFDNDGTLWTEQPIYFQLAFAIDRVKAMAPQHPERKDAEPSNRCLPAT
jgi:hypothetical protein